MQNQTDLKYKSTDWIRHNAWPSVGSYDFAPVAKKSLVSFVLFFVSFSKALASEVRHFLSLQICFVF